MLLVTAPSVLPELDDKPSRPAPPELPKLLDPLKVVAPLERLAPLELLELLELRDLLDLSEAELEPVRRTRTVISSRPGIEGTGTMSRCQCQSPLPNALMSPSVVPAVGSCRLSRVSALRIT